MLSGLERTYERRGLTWLLTVQAYKYVPFGEVEQVIPYLVRRAQENSSVLGGVEKEKKMVASEIRRRLFRQPAKQQPEFRSQANLGH